MAQKRKEAQEILNQQTKENLAKRKKPRVPRFEPDEPKETKIEVPAETQVETLPELRSDEKNPEKKLQKLSQNKVWK